LKVNKRSLRIKMCERDGKEKKEHKMCRKRNEEKERRMKVKLNMI
jgi:hypothetical protein